MTSNPVFPRRGEVWDVNFDPTIGAEIRKVRPAVVVSSDGVGRLPLKLVAPITEWKDVFAGNLWHVRVNPNTQNGLTKPSAVDAMQVRSVSTERFLRRRGYLAATLLEEIAAAIAAVVEYG